MANTLASISRAFSSKETARLVKKVIKSGVRYRKTKSGLIFYGKDGKAVSIHFSSSDHRAHQNMVKGFKQAGIDI